MQRGDTQERMVGIASGAFLRTIMLTAAAIAGLITVDTFLARLERAEGHAESRRLYQQGTELLSKGRTDEALNRLTNAVAIERDNREYLLSLSEALVAAGRLEEAERQLGRLLDRASTDGDANLAMARVLRKQGTNDDAKAYYHRAIFGQWKADPVANRVRVRFELLALLEAANANEEMLAELLPLQEEAPQDLATRKQIGRLFTVAGSPNRAAALFRQVLQESPLDADAYVGIGDSEFAVGRYRSARANFSAAARITPQSELARQRVLACDRILKLDPMQRGLRGTERYSRSLQLLRSALGSAQRCRADSANEEREALTEQATKLLRQPTPLRLGESAEAPLDLAEKLWAARNPACGSPPSIDPAVVVLLDRLASQ